MTSKKLAESINLSLHQICTNSSRSLSGHSIFRITRSERFRQRWNHTPTLFNSFRSFLVTRALKIEEDGIDLRNKYDPGINSAYWEIRPVVVTSRLTQICTAFGVWYANFLLRGKKHKQAAAELKSVLTTLGPAFVKIGQVVSSRPDIVPPDYLYELEKLQDRIPPFSTTDALEIIERDLGVPASQIFSEISPQPVAAASLGQVYKARLLRTGDTVAVKVQRPSVIESIALDVYILRMLASFVKNWKKTNSDLPALIDEWATSLFKELDYKKEAENGNRFRALFGGMRGVHAPLMYESLTTPRVLVMEWVDGIRLKTNSTDSTEEIELENRENLKLVDVGVRCSLEQMLEEGFYHADPHPGNLLKTAQGKLCYLDFGMMGEINRETRQALIRATLHLVNREFGQLAEDFITLGMLPQESDPSQITPVLTSVFEKATAGGMDSMSFGDFSADLGFAMYKYKFNIPPYYTLLIRSLTVLEGIALHSDKNYKVLKAAYPWVARRLLTDKSPELRATLKALLYKQNKFRFERLEGLLQSAMQVPGREQSFGEGEVGQVTGRPLKFVLSEEGKFVREILLEELAKGIDAAWRLGLDVALQNAKESVIKYLGSNFQLRDIVFGIPVLSEDIDREQVAGLMKLSKAMQDMAENDEMWSKDGRGRNSIAQTSAALMWLIKEMQNLPESSRQEALRIPMTIISKVSSRILARGLRNTLGQISKPRRNNNLEMVVDDSLVDVIIEQNVSVI